MAVYKQTYKPYHGELTGTRWRFAILTRYAFKEVFESRLITAMFALSFAPPLIAAVLIYLIHNIEALAAIGMSAADLVPIDGEFFSVIVGNQTFLTFVLVTFIGPGLVSPDLMNNALPLYLSRPFSRAEYVLGKLGVLVALTSLMSWIPILLLFLMQSNLAGLDWMRANLRIAAAIVVVCGIWILTISLLALALSAWVKWKPVAGGALLGVFFATAGFGAVVNDLLNLEPDWGLLLAVPVVLDMLFEWLFAGRSIYDGMPAWTGLLALAGYCLLSLYMLHRKIRACEVVR